MHVCSALCATSSHGCCEKGDNDNDKKECCKHENESDGETKDCQDMHFAFFNTTGQFSLAKFYSCCIAKGISKAIETASTVSL